MTVSKNGFPHQDDTSLISRCLVDLDCCLSSSEADWNAGHKQNKALSTNRNESTGLSENHDENMISLQGMVST